MVRAVTKMTVMVNAVATGGRRVAATLLASLLVASCAVGPGARVDVARYDFGSAPVPASSAATPDGGAPLLVDDAVAPEWMDSASMHYRLAYEDAAQPRAYANSRWMMPPAALFTGRLRQRLAATGAVLVPADGLRAAHALRIEIEEFSQVFDSPRSSRAMLRVRASLFAGVALVAQRTFSIERAAPTADAQGGVRALTAATDALIGQVQAWTAASMRK